MSMEISEHLRIPVTHHRGVDGVVSEAGMLGMLAFRLWLHLGLPLALFAI